MGFRLQTTDYCMLQTTILGFVVRTIWFRIRTTPIKSQQILPSRYRFMVGLVRG